MELSRRMEEVLALTEPCQAAADVGCDHGYIAIELIRRGFADRVFAMDVRQGPLSRAQTHIREANLQSQIECRLSDGLSALQPGEADCILMAGMGGPLMIRILEQSIEKLDGVQTLVLQPQSEIPAVRRYLHKIGYRITRERMVQEAGKYYTLLQGKPGQEQYSDPIQYQYGAVLLQERSQTLLSYLKQEAALYTKIRTQLNQEPTEKARAREQEVDEILNRNREAQRKYEII